MRMWKVPTKFLCKQHLLGEHVEMHMFVGAILKGKSIKGFVENNLVEVHNIFSRHQELSEEMIKRGINHKSEIKSFPACQAGSVDIQNNLEELRTRCPKCKLLMEQENKHE